MDIIFYSLELLLLLFLRALHTYLIRLALRITKAFQFWLSVCVLSGKQG